VTRESVKQVNAQSGEACGFNVFHIEQRLPKRRATMQAEVTRMNKQRVKGAIDEVVGSAKRHVGGATGNINLQAKGAAQQIKGKVETGVGKLKDAVRDASDSAAARNDAKYKDRKISAAENRNIL